jgi:hypothetical protein
MNQKFPYIFRISEKAKRVRFQVSAEKGLEIVVPKRFNASRVPSLVEKNSQWIEQAFQKAKAFQGLISPMADWQIPEEITSLALDQTWRVLACSNEMKSVVVRETSATTLVMHGATDDADACQTALKEWLTHKAEDHLIPWLKRASDEKRTQLLSGINQAATDPMGQLFCAPFDQSQRTAFVFAARVGYLRAGARVVSHEAFKPLTQILATGRVLSTRSSTI